MNWPCADSVPFVFTTGPRIPQTEGTVSPTRPIRSFHLLPSPTPPHDAIRLTVPGRDSMVTHMKTTVEIPDALFAEARRAAARDKITLKILIEEGLRRAIEERGRKGKFRLRKASFRGKGLHRDIEGGSWEKIRDLAYEGRGA
jgi:hypothetical protein